MVDNWKDVAQKNVVRVVGRKNRGSCCRMRFNKCVWSSLFRTKSLPFQACVLFFRFLIASWRIAFSLHSVAPLRCFTRLCGTCSLQRCASMGGPFQYMNGAWSTVEWNVAKGVSDAILGSSRFKFTGTWNSSPALRQFTSLAVRRFVNPGRSGG